MTRDELLEILTDVFPDDCAKVRDEFDRLKLIETKARGLVRTSATHPRTGEMLVVPTWWRALVEALGES